jgi:septum formation protein
VKVVLASGSPQRSEILRKLAVEFEVVVPGVEELIGGDPEFEVLENARRKAHAAARAGGAAGRTAPEEASATAGGGGSPAATGPARQQRLVIACDTDVVLDGRALGKPGDEGEAREYLERLSGRAHEVLSGLVVLAAGEERSGLERTAVVFKQLSEAERERYVRFGEWRGRSGGYAIQTLGSTLVARIEGSVSNVVGLPVGLLAELAPELFERGAAP